MKIFGCKNQMSYGGGLVLVAANTVEEAYLTAIAHQTHILLENGMK